MAFKSVSIVVGDLTFTAELPIVQSQGFPGKVMVSGDDVGRLEQAVARWIIEHGVDGPDALKALRSAAGLTGSQLAELLGTDRARISDWENGKANPGRALYATLARLALDAMQGTSDTADYLRAMQTERPTVGTIKLAVG